MYVSHSVEVPQQVNSTRLHRIYIKIDCYIDLLLTDDIRFIFMQTAVHGAASASVFAFFALWIAGGPSTPRTPTSGPPSGSTARFRFSPACSGPSSPPTSFLSFSRLPWPPRPPRPPRPRPRPRPPLAPPLAPPRPLPRIGPPSSVFRRTARAAD